MKKHLAIFTALTLTFSASVYAQDSSSSSSVSSSSSSSSSVSPAKICSGVQICVDNAIAPAVVSCLAADTQGLCINSNNDRFAVSAGALARRAIDRKSCLEKTNKPNCNGCFKNARNFLRNRMSFDIFKGLLAQSVALIDLERQKVCKVLPGKGEGKKSSSSSSS